MEEHLIPVLVIFPSPFSLGSTTFLFKSNWCSKYLYFAHASCKRYKKWREFQQTWPTRL